eukprot:m.534729 g.534729  ORF g.534729 m.534729 type:complete len:129 (-) comp22059_c0_seq4:2346-2732(-)
MHVFPARSKGESVFQQAGFRPRGTARVHDGGTPSLSDHPGTFYRGECQQKWHMSEQSRSFLRRCMIPVRYPTMSSLFALSFCSVSHPCTIADERHTRIQRPLIHAPLSEARSSTNLLWQSPRKQDKES